MHAKGRSASIHPDLAVPKPSEKPNWFMELLNGKSWLLNLLKPFFRDDFCELVENGFGSHLDALLK